MTERVATSAEIAAALGLSASTVQLYARQGRIPFATTPGGHRRYSVSEVQLALASATYADIDDDAVALSFTPLASGLGVGRPGPASMNARMLRAQRATTFESSGYGGQANVAGPAGPALLERLLAGLEQGDLISIGAVNIVGRGSTAMLSEVTEASHSAGQLATPLPDELWSLTMDSAVGWYVLLSQACDIVRSPEIEPCVVVCPVMLVTKERYAQLRHGAASPREFPLPADKLRAACDASNGQEFFPVADLRWLASVDKTAIAHPRLQTLRALTPPQQHRLAMWAARRFGRATHPDPVEQHVLKRAARIVTRALNDSTGVAVGKWTLQQKLVRSTDAWLVTSAEKNVTFTLILAVELAKNAGLFNRAEGSIDSGAAHAAAKALTKDLVATVTGGYGVKLELTTWDALAAADYLDRPEWIWQSEPNPLAE